MADGDSGSSVKVELRLGLRALPVRPLVYAVLTQRLMKDGWNEVARTEASHTAASDVSFDAPIRLKFFPERQQDMRCDVYSAPAGTHVPPAPAPLEEFKFMGSADTSLKEVMTAVGRMVNLSVNGEGLAPGVELFMVGYEFEKAIVAAGNVTCSFAVGGLKFPSPTDLILTFHAAAPSSGGDFTLAWASEPVRGVTSSGVAPLIKLPIHILTRGNLNSPIRVDLEVWGPRGAFTRLAGVVTTIPDLNALLSSPASHLTLSDATGAVLAYVGAGEDSVKFMPVAAAAGGEAAAAVVVPQRPPGPKPTKPTRPVEPRPGSETSSSPSPAPVAPAPRDPTPVAAEPTPAPAPVPVPVEAAVPVPVEAAVPVAVARVPTPPTRSRTPSVVQRDPTPVPVPAAVDPTPAPALPVPAATPAVAEPEPARAPTPTPPGTPPPTSTLRVPTPTPAEPEPVKPAIQLPSKPTSTSKPAAGATSPVKPASLPTSTAPATTSTAAVTTPTVPAWKLKQQAAAASTSKPATAAATPAPTSTRSFLPSTSTSTTGGVAARWGAKSSTSTAAASTPKPAPGAIPKSTGTSTSTAVSRAASPTSSVASSTSTGVRSGSPFGATVSRGKTTSSPPPVTSTGSSSSRRPSIPMNSTSTVTGEGLRAPPQAPSPTPVNVLAAAAAAVQVQQTTSTDVQEQATSTAEGEQATSTVAGEQATPTVVVEQESTSTAAVTTTTSTVSESTSTAVAAPVDVTTPTVDAPLPTSTAAEPEPPAPATTTSTVDAPVAVEVTTSTAAAPVPVAQEAAATSTVAAEPLPPPPPTSTVEPTSTTTPSTSTVAVTAGEAASTSTPPSVAMQRVPEPPLPSTSTASSSSTLEVGVDTRFTSLPHRPEPPLRRAGSAIPSSLALQVAAAVDLNLPPSSSSTSTALLGLPPRSASQPQPEVAHTFEGYDSSSRAPAPAPTSTAHQSTSTAAVDSNPRDAYFNRSDGARATRETVARTLLNALSTPSSAVQVVHEPEPGYDALSQLRSWASQLVSLQDVAAEFKSSAYEGIRAEAPITVQVIQAIAATGAPVSTSTWRSLALVQATASSASSSVTGHEPHAVQVVHTRLQALRTPVALACLGLATVQVLHSALRSCVMVTRQDVLQVGQQLQLALRETAAVEMDVAGQVGLTLANISGSNAGRICDDSPVEVLHTYARQAAQLRSSVSLPDAADACVGTPVLVEHLSRHSDAVQVAAREAIRLECDGLRSVLADLKAQAAQGEADLTSTRVSAESVSVEVEEAQRALLEMRSSVAEKRLASEAEIHTLAHGLAHAEGFKLVTQEGVEQEQGEGGDAGVKFITLATLVELPFDDSPEARSRRFSLMIARAESEARAQAAEKYNALLARERSEVGARLNDAVRSGQGALEALDAALRSNVEDEAAKRAAHVRVASRMQEVDAAINKTAEEAAGLRARLEACDAALAASRRATASVAELRMLKVCVRRMWDTRGISYGAMNPFLAHALRLAPYSAALHAALQRVYTCLKGGYTPACIPWDVHVWGDDTARAAALASVASSALAHATGDALSTPAVSSLQSMMTHALPSLAAVLKSESTVQAVLKGLQQPTGSDIGPNARTRIAAAPSTVRSDLDAALTGVGRAVVPAVDLDTLLHPASTSATNLTFMSPHSTAYALASAAAVGAAPAAAAAVLPSDDAFTASFKYDPHAYAKLYAEAALHSAAPRVHSLTSLRKAAHDDAKSAPPPPPRTSMTAPRPPPRDEAASAVTVEQRAPAPAAVVAAAPPPAAAPVEQELDDDARVHVGIAPRVKLTHTAAAPKPAPVPAPVPAPAAARKAVPAPAPVTRSASGRRLSEISERSNVTDAEEEYVGVYGGDELSSAPAPPAVRSEAVGAAVALFSSHVGERTHVSSLRAATGSINPHTASVLAATRGEVDVAPPPGLAPPPPVADGKPKGPTIRVEMRPVHTAEDVAEDEAAAARVGVTNDPSSKYRFLSQPRADAGTGGAQRSAATAPATSASDSETGGVLTAAVAAAAFDALMQSRVQISQPTPSLPTPAPTQLHVHSYAPAPSRSMSNSRSYAPTFTTMTTRTAAPAPSPAQEAAYHSPPSRSVSNGRSYAPMFASRTPAPAPAPVQAPVRAFSHHPQPMAVDVPRPLATISMSAAPVQPTLAVAAAPIDRDSSMADILSSLGYITPTRSSTPASPPAPPPPEPPAPRNGYMPLISGNSHSPTAAIAPDGSSFSHANTAAALLAPAYTQMSDSVFALPAPPGVREGDIISGPGGIPYIAVRTQTLPALHAEAASPHTRFDLDPRARYTHGLTDMDAVTSSQTPVGAGAASAMPVIVSWPTQGNAPPHAHSHMAAINPTAASMTVAGADYSARVWAHTGGPDRRTVPMDGRGEAQASRSPSPASRGRGEVSRWPRESPRFQYGSSELGRSLARDAFDTDRSGTYVRRGRLQEDASGSRAAVMNASVSPSPAARTAALRGATMPINVGRR